MRETVIARYHGQEKQMTAKTLIAKMINVEVQLGALGNTDGQHVIRDDRMKLQSTIERPSWQYSQEGTDKASAVRDSMAECTRVLDMWIDLR